MKPNDLDSRVGSLRAQRRAAFWRDIRNPAGKRKRRNLDAVVPSLFQKLAHIVELPVLVQLVTHRKAHSEILFQPVIFRLKAEATTFSSSLPAFTGSQVSKPAGSRRR